MSKPRVRKWAGNETLRTFYDHFNKTYWDGKLIEPALLRFVKNLPDDGHTSWRSTGSVIISIDEDFRKHPDICCVVLLHEMIHVALGFGYQGDHGMRYQAEKYRLLLAGAYDKLI